MGSESIDERIGSRVRQALAARKLSQKALADQFGQSQAWISRRVRGEVGFSVAELAQAAKLLSVPLDFFIGGAEVVSSDLTPVAS